MDRVEAVSPFDEPQNIGWESERDEQFIAGHLRRSVWW